MIKIRTKLLIYFVALLVLIVVVFFIREQSNQRVMELYDESVEQLFLLNEITRMTTQTFQSLQIYVHEPLPQNLTYYEDDKRQLLRLQHEFAINELDGITKKNYLNMLSSFLEQSDATIEGVNRQDIQQYSLSLNEADITASYIHEQTLELINDELTDYKELSVITEDMISNTEKMWTMIILSIIIVSVLFALWFSDGITRTIGRLTKAAQRISAGNYSGEDVVVSRKDELWFLTKTFNEMKQNIHQSVTEIEEKARLAQLLKEMELKSLQNQINPHFLFNTLNSISKTAYIEGAERTSDLISSVSALLRYNIGNLDRETLLKDEVKIVKEYFFIQKTRFGDRVTFEEEIEPECLSTPIPCLTLQPIIENAFMHGIEEMSEGAHIVLIIKEVNGMVCIEIKDNGVGMDQETIDRLLDTRSPAKKGSGHSTGIGMRNVINRLTLFDKESHIDIESMHGKGTTVKIYITKR
ncbi:histidine kinase [Bacillus sp. JCM 19034]|uniref:sensor histidine kinase n=1 Tax=Bacillus sp. JCM 19034 TaxID=1481928 RepID=UPI000786644E|nr:histidine kinase [Bacillus sp. JCM 19034]